MSVDQLVERARGGHRRLGREDRRRGVRPAGRPVGLPARRRHRQRALRAAGRAIGTELPSAVLPGNAARPCSPRSWRTSGRRGWLERARVAVEKPFGHDLASARELNARLRAVLDEDQILRVDHFLGKQPVVELEYLRFANQALAAAVGPAQRFRDPNHHGRGLRRRGPRQVLRRGWRACATSCRTICCRCSPWSRWSRRSARAPTT